MPIKSSCLHASTRKGLASLSLIVYEISIQSCRAVLVLNLSLMRWVGSNNIHTYVGCIPTRSCTKLVFCTASSSKSLCNPLQKISE